MSHDNQWDAFVDATLQRMGELSLDIDLPTLDDEIERFGRALTEAELVMLSRLPRQGETRYLENAPHPDDGHLYDQSPPNLRTVPLCKLKYRSRGFARWRARQLIREGEQLYRFFETARHYVAQYTWPMGWEVNR